jgi:hypothetical protein
VQVTSPPPANRSTRCLCSSSLRFSLAPRGKKKVFSLLPPRSSSPATDRYIQSSPRNVTVRVHNVRPANGLETHRSARTNRQTPLISPHLRASSQAYLPLGSQVIRFRPTTLHVSLAHQGSDHRPSPHFQPKIRLPNCQRVRLSSVDPFKFAMSSST